MVDNILDSMGIQKTGKQENSLARQPRPTIMPVALNGIRQKSEEGLGEDLCPMKDFYEAELMMIIKGFYSKLLDF